MLWPYGQRRDPDDRLLVLEVGEGEGGCEEGDGGKLVNAGYCGGGS